MIIIFSIIIIIVNTAIVMLIIFYTLNQYNYLTTYYSIECYLLA